MKHVQAFLGFCNFYCRFIQGFSDIARPLFNLTKKDEPFIWSPSCETAFQQLIQVFITASVLALPDHSQPFHLITDASDFVTGAILEQPDALNCWHPVAYHSKSLQLAEHNYKVHDKELLAIVIAVETFRCYLEGLDTPFEVWSDHANLVYLFSKQKHSHRQARWALALSCFHFIIIHKPSVLNKSDALSLHPDHKGGLALDNEEHILLDSKFFIQTIRPMSLTIHGDTTL